MTRVILPVDPCISRSIQVVDLFRKRRVRRCTDFYQLNSSHFIVDILSVTCFAQMKYACILFIPHPTGGLRLIDSRLCSLLPISFVPLVTTGRTLQVSLVVLPSICMVQS